MGGYSTGHVKKEKSIRYNGVKIPLSEIKGKFEYLESIIHSESRRLRLNGVRDCMLDQEVFVANLMSLTDMIREGLHEIYDSISIEAKNAKP